jgi:hypothetical protein
MHGSKRSFHVTEDLGVGSDDIFLYYFNKNINSKIKILLINLFFFIIKSIANI